MVKEHNIFVINVDFINKFISIYYIMSRDKFRRNYWDHRTRNNYSDYLKDYLKDNSKKDSKIDSKKLQEYYEETVSFRNSIFIYVLCCCYIVAFIFNIINITKHDYGEDKDHQFMKDILNLVNVVGFGLTLLYISYKAIDKEWFYLTYFLSLMFFVFMILVKKDKDGNNYPRRLLHTLTF